MSDGTEPKKRVGLFRRIGRYFLFSFAILGFFIFVLAGGALVTILATDRTPTLPEKMVLYLDLRDGLVDNRSDDPWRALRNDKTVYLHEAVDGLQAAQNDSRVAGLVMRLGAVPLKLAHIQELSDAVAAFRKQGKPAAVYAESLDHMTTYAAAAAAGEIWVQPSGLIGMTGISLEFPFIKDALDKVGVNAEFEQRLEYKSAAEVFTRNGMSEPARQSWESIAKAWFDQMTAAIAASRNVREAEIRRLVNSAPFLASEAKAQGLVDVLGYWDDFRSELERRFSQSAGNDGGSDDVGFVPLGTYGAAQQINGAGPSVALIHGIGPVVMSGKSGGGPFSGSETFSADRISAAIRAAADDDEIKGILLRIDSPGGSYVASDTVRAAVRAARQAGKPVIASMGATAASGGYFAAMGANKIVALPGTLTGSIGVFGGKFSLAEVWQKLGIGWAQIKIGAQAGSFSSNRPFTESEKNRYRAILDFIYEDFTAKAAKDRSLDDTAIDSAARGRVWTGVGAKQAGLIDDVGGLTRAVELIRKELELEENAPVNLTYYPPPKPPFEQLLETIANGPLLGLATMWPVREFDFVRRWAEGHLGLVAATPSPYDGVLQIPPFTVGN